MQDGFTIISIDLISMKNEEVVVHFLAFLLQITRLEQMEMIPQEPSCAVDVCYHGIVEAAICP